MSEDRIPEADGATLLDVRPGGRRRPRLELGDLFADDALPERTRRLGLPSEASERPWSEPPSWSERGPGSSDDGRAGDRPSGEGAASASGPPSGDRSDTDRRAARVDSIDVVGALDADPGAPAFASPSASASADGARTAVAPHPLASLTYDLDAGPLLRAPREAPAGAGPPATASAASQPAVAVAVAVSVSGSGEPSQARTVTDGRPEPRTEVGPAPRRATRTGSRGGPGSALGGPALALLLAAAALLLAVLVLTGVL